MNERPPLRRDAVDFLAAFTVGAVIAAWLTVWVRRLRQQR